MKLSYKPSSRREKAISKLLDNLRDKIILDIGCADGSLGKIFKKSNQVIGVDISKEDLKKAKKVLDQTFLVDLNSQKIPLKNQSVDIIICSEVIEHLLPGNKLLSEAKRILKKDGFLIITTPNILYWGHRLNFLKGQFEYTDQGPFDKTHVHFYTYGTLKKELEQNNFKIVRENHIFLGNSLISLFAKNFPTLFAYQFVLKIDKF